MGNSRYDYKLYQALTVVAEALGANHVEIWNIETSIGDRDFKFSSCNDDTIWWGLTPDPEVFPEQILHQDKNGWHVYANHGLFENGGYYLVDTLLEDE